MKNMKPADALSANKTPNCLISKAFFAVLAIAPMFSPTSASEIVHLTSFQSEAGESLDAFALRIADPMSEWSSKTGAEACGAITRKGDAYHVIVTTQGSQVQCDSQLVRKGWEYTGQTIHTHAMPGADGALTVTPVTAQVSSGHLHAGERIKPVYGPSGGDYETGPGYVVLGDVVVHQAGRGTDREVGRVGVELAGR